jgi:hypothetical protein
VDVDVDIDELQDMDLFADELDERYNAGTISSASSSSSASSATSCASCGCTFSCLCCFSFAAES